MQNTQTTYCILRNAPIRRQARRAAAPRMTEGVTFNAQVMDEWPGEAEIESF
jgi:hypothetical protein